MLRIVDHRISLRVCRGQADGLEPPEGSSLRRVLARGWDTTGVSERGMSSEGERGNFGEPMRLLVAIRWRRAARMGTDARRCEAVRASQAHHVREQTGHTARRATRGIGEGQGAPHDPERGHWQSSRRRVPRVRNREFLTGTVGNQRPRDPLEGRRRRASRAAGGTSGRDAGITNHLHATPEHGRTGTPLAGEGVQHRVAPDRRRRPAGSLPPHPEGPCAGGGQGDGEAVGRAPGGEPSRPA
jgi:hypothetical protein